MERIDLPYAVFTLALDFDSRQPVSRFPAATLRGGFGYTLRGLVCTTPAIDCHDCLLKHRCPYSFLFETPPPPGASRLSSYSDIPRPFALRPCTTGATGHWELLLIGSALPYLPYVIHALNQSGANGIGKHRARFTIREVTCGPQVVYPVGANEIEPRIAASAQTIAAGAPQEGTVRLTFQTPLVLRVEGKTLQEIQPLPFVKALLRRITNLDAFFGSGSAGVDPQPYIDAARTLVVESAELESVKQSRISTHQNREIDYSGILGTAILSGEIGVLLPLLAAGTVFGVGKNTVFGYGVYKLELAQ